VSETTARTADSSRGAVGAAVRAEFPILERAVYFNSCSQGALSRRVRHAYETYIEGWDRNGAEWETWAGRASDARAAFARLVGARADEVALSSSVSHVVGTVMSALRFEQGERTRIVISDYEFPSVGQVAHAQELRGAEIVHVPPAADGSIRPEAFAAVVDERTALVCCTLVSYTTGHRLDVASIARVAHDSGALCLVDGYQGIGALDVDAPELGVDLLTGGTVKYLLASPGLAFLYVRDGLAAKLEPTQTGWHADEDVFAMDIHDYSPAPDARRFDSGTPPVPNVYGAVAGMSLIEDAGTRTIEDHVAGLGDRLIDGLDELGATVVTPRDGDERGPLVCVRSTDVEKLVAALAAERILVSSRAGNVRVAIHLYNTIDDVDALLASLAAKTDLLA
jgi:selenocysteine lyase/cysteine desulfurase